MQAVQLCVGCLLLALQTRASLAGRRLGSCCTGWRHGPSKGAAGAPPASVSVLEPAGMHVKLPQQACGLHSEPSLQQLVHVQLTLHWLARLHCYTSCHAL